MNLIVFKGILSKDITLLLSKTIFAIRGKTKELATTSVTEEMSRSH